MGKVIASDVRTRALMTGRGSAHVDASRSGIATGRNAIEALLAGPAINGGLPPPALRGVGIQLTRTTARLGSAANLCPVVAAMFAPRGALTGPYSIPATKHRPRTVSSTPSSLGWCQDELICEPGQGRASRAAPAHSGRAPSECAHSTERKASPRSATAALILPVAGKSLAVASPRRNWPAWRQRQQVTATGPLSAGPKVDRLSQAGKIVPTPRVPAGNCVCA